MDHSVNAPIAKGTPTKTVPGKAGTTCLISSCCLIALSFGLILLSLSATTPRVVARRAQMQLVCSKMASLGKAVGPIPHQSAPLPTAARALSTTRAFDVLCDPTKFLLGHKEDQTQFSLCSQFVKTARAAWEPRI